MSRIKYKIPLLSACAIMSYEKDIGDEIYSFHREVLSRQQLSIVGVSCWHTTKPDEVKGISINPNGDVIICAFIIGNIYKDNIIDIIANYNPYDNPLMAALMYNGIAGLCEFAGERGIVIDLADYYSPCDICHDIVKKLTKFIPENII